jgi:hypothetical protein
VAPELQSFLRDLPDAQVRQATPLGLVLRPDLDANSWSTLVASVAQLAGRVSRQRETATAWLGDLLAFGHGKYRGQITSYAEAAGLDPGTLRVAKLVCSRIPVLSRHNALSWSHHCEVGRAFKDPRDIHRWLDLAATERLSVRGLRKRIRLHQAESQPAATADSGDGPSIRLELMRGIHTARCLIQKHPDTWAEWSVEACELALAEMRPILAFFEAVRAHTRVPRP